MKHTAAVITVSDKILRGEQADTGGPAIAGMLEEVGVQVVHTALVPDDKEQIQAALVSCADGLGVNLAVTAGGNSLSPKDVTPEATMAVMDREVRGMAEAMRAAGMQATVRGCLSRGVAVTRGRTLIINLPGSAKAARENLSAVIGALGHAVDML